MDAGVEHLAKRVDDFGPDATKPFSKSIGAQEHHGARFRFREWSADTASVRAHQIYLELANLYCGDSNGSEFAETSVDAIGGLTGRDKAIDDGTGSFHALDGVRSEMDLVAVKSDSIQLLEGEVVASQGDCARDGAHALLTGEPLLDISAKRARYFCGSILGRPLLPQMTCLVSPVARSSLSESRRSSYE